MTTIDREIGNFKECFVPFGSADIYRAIQVALEVGEDGDWAADQSLSIIEELTIPINKIDVVCAVYEAILQDARNEIEEYTKFDFANDGADVYVEGNYMATTFDFQDNANDTIKEKLIAEGISFEDLSQKTQWFLTQIKANY